MRYKAPPLVWILDLNPINCAKYQTDKSLGAGIMHLFFILLSAYLIAKGIKRCFHIKYYLKGSEENRQKLFELCFPGWDDIPELVANKAKPFNEYSKWTGQCKIHFNFMLDMFEAFLFEYSRRFQKRHRLEKYLDNFKDFPPDLPDVKLKRLILPFKGLYPQYRTVNQIDGIRRYFVKVKVHDPLIDYQRSDIPEWIMKPSFSSIV